MELARLCAADAAVDFIGGDGWTGIISDTALAEGVYVGTTFTAEDPRPEVQRFVTEFRERYGVTPDMDADTIGASILGMHARRSHDVHRRRRDRHDHLAARSDALERRVRGEAAEGDHARRRAAGGRPLFAVCRTADTEVLAHLVGELYDGSLEEAVAAALRDVDGAYGLAFISEREPGGVVAARKGSPLLVGVGEDEYFVASDASPLLEHTRSVVYLDDGEMAILTPDGYRIRNLETTQIDKPVNQIEWDLATIERGGDPHFMLKEICEQQESVTNTLRGHLLEDEGTARVTGLNLSDEQLKRIDRIIITACGTSWHAGLIGEYMLEEMARIPVEVEYASEFRYRNPVVDERTLVIAISQSGETADTLAAVREAKLRGARTIGLVNVVGSTIAREVDGGIYLHAGPEVGVASTKAFTSQVAALALVSLRIARLRNLSILQGRDFIQHLQALPGKIQQILDRSSEMEQLAERFVRAANALYLGRGVNFPVALEGALKLKEISYIHAEGYPAAEMKHGPIALIDEMMPVVFIAPKDAVYQKIISNMEEVKARGGKVIALVNECDPQVDRLADACIEIPESHELLSPILTIIPLQLFSYYVAVRRGCNVDQPRNLAKSVTVE